MKCRNIGANKDIIWFGKDPSLPKTKLWYSVTDPVHNKKYYQGFLPCTTLPETVLIGDPSTTYTLVLDTDSEINGKLMNGANECGVFCWTSDKVPTYVEDTDAVCASLTQRLRVIKGELWYQINYGIPLAENYKSRAVFDSVLQDIITSHPGVSKIESFESKITGNEYSYNCVIESIFGETFSVSA